MKDALAEYTDTFARAAASHFPHMMGGPMDDPVANRNREIVKDFYYDYVRDWYKTH